MLVDVTVTYLEMTSADQLVTGMLPPAEIVLDRVDATTLALIRSTHDRIAAPHHWSSLGWSEQQWLNLLARPGMRCWIARVGAEVIGMILMDRHAGGDVEITKFGLVPEWVGRGFGGHLLTLATRLAWDLGKVDRVWLGTTSIDHPHALSNYRGRGFRPFRIEHTPRQV
ncbi:MAG: GNAT family N-acetyltransferase [Pseudonocardiaceae bacterium]